MSGSAEEGRELQPTRPFHQLVQKRVTNEPAFGEVLLRESIDTMLAGDVDTGKAILRDYIKETIGFERLGVETGSVRNRASLGPLVGRRSRR